MTKLQDRLYGAVIFGTLFLAATVIFLLFSAVNAEAQTPEASIEIEYIAPTEYDDNSPINPGELAEWQLGCGLASGDRSIVLDMWLDDGGMMHSGPVAAGNYFCAVRVNASAAGLPGPGPYSDWSNEVVLSALPKPRPAVLVAITVVAGS